MSRHLLVDRPRLQVVLGFDHPLRSFFGLLLNPAADPDHVLDGWPTRRGLGTPMPAECHSMADADLRQLFAWARKQQPHFVWIQSDANAHVTTLRGVLLSEWESGTDAVAVPVPACLQGER